ncbi:MAG: rhomboid family intramembrane serine protease [Desulfocapsaceae bacterium]|nr:rhomboid family intramembrane serine protease [Desulfocapsaceae bacterium]
MEAKNQDEIEVIVTNDQEYIATCSLVLSAVDITHTIVREDTNLSIRVASGDATMAKHHLASYDQENKEWPPQPIHLEEQSGDTQPPTFIVIGALMLFYYVTGPWDSGSVWFNSGAGDADAIIYGGEFYRLVTALTLHADLTHLLGNCIIGGFLLHFFCRLVGSGFGLAAILTAATLGNGINVFLRGENHLFIGFSTAVFATIGMLVIVSYRSKKNQSRFQLFLPFMAGTALLAMLGSSGERTDLGAHLFGLLSGLAIGFLIVSDKCRKLRQSSFLQLVLFILTCSTVYLCWTVALTRTY